MREIISIQVGNFGVSVGDEFWGNIGVEHGVDNSGSLTHSTFQGLPVFYHETKSGKHIPRSLFIDTEPGAIDSLRGRKRGKLYREDNYITSKLGSGGNFALANREIGPQMMNRIMDVVRKEVEACDRFSGFQIIHSMGGTGSGLTALLLAKFREEYCSNIVSTQSLFPSLDSASIYEIYNCIHTLKFLTEYANLTTIFDNAALAKICKKEFSVAEPSFSELNNLLSQAITENTSSYRFAGILNTDMAKHTVNIVPYPRLHYVYSSLAPFGYLNDQLNTRDEQEVIDYLFHPSHSLCTINPSAGQYYTASANFRGQWSTAAVESAMKQFVTSGSATFPKFIPDNIQISYCNTPTPYAPKSASLLANNSDVLRIFESLSSRFSENYQKRVLL